LDLNWPISKKNKKSSVESSHPLKNNNKTFLEAHPRIYHAKSFVIVAMNVSTTKLIEQF
jgi:hypothetical protein